MPFARRGFRVTCVELGERLAAVARANLEEFEKADVVHADFETWETDEVFDAVVAFTALHWVERDLRYAKPARLLRDGGALAVVETEHVRDDNRFWLDVQEDYDAVVPSPSNRPSPRPDEVGDLSGVIDASGFFRTIAVRKHMVEIVYTTDEYIDTLATYSPNIALDEVTRRRLFERIRARVERAGGTIAKPYLFVVNVARRVM